MPSKNSATVTIVKRKRHKVPAYWTSVSQRKHNWPSSYGNGANGELRRPANQPTRNQK
jgi:hypothetical protein